MSIHRGVSLWCMFDLFRIVCELMPLSIKVRIGKSRSSEARLIFTQLKDIVYDGINLHTVRHKSVLHNTSQSQSHHPATRQASLPRQAQAFSSSEYITHFTRRHTQNAMPQASIRPQGDYLKEMKVSRTELCRGRDVWCP